MISLSTDLLLKIFLLADHKDLANISRVSKTWKSLLDDFEQMIWKSLMTNCYPRLSKIIEMGPDDNGYSWKEGFKTHVVPSFEPEGLNLKLQKDLQTVFSPRGIMAFTNWPARDRPIIYSLADSFQHRQGAGVYCFAFHLNGFSYDAHRYTHGIQVHYKCWNYYLDTHWEQERKFLVQFCTILGLEEGEYNIQKPGSIESDITIEFLKPLVLEEPPVGDEDESDSEIQDMDTDDDDDGDDDELDDDEEEE